MHEQNIRVINILSASYSGSTWANLLIGSHPEAFSVGEIDQILKHPATFGSIYCGLHGHDCPLWSQYDINSTENPYQQIARITGKRVFVVNNSRHLLAAQNAPGIESRWIYLMRDGRAVVASGKRKRAHQSMFRLSRGWHRTVTKKLRQFKNAPAEHRMMCHYELFTRHPEPYARRICELAGVEFDAAMLEYWNRQHHFLGGSPGALSFAAATPEQMTNLRGRYDRASHTHGGYKLDLSHYEKARADSFQDDRWKSELTPRQLLIFALSAGRTNRRFGYGPTTDRSDRSPTPFDDERSLIADLTG